jgi:hypothetical protein
MLCGTVSSIEGSRLICGLRFTAKIEDFDPDILTFVAINSEADALPNVANRQYWSPEALAKLQPEIERLEKWAHDFARVSCHRIIERFGEPAS